MVTPAPPLTPAPEMVPVAFLGRTSTLHLQDPAASLRRQVREVKAHLPAGFVLTAYFWDIESGGLDIDKRGQSTSWQGVDAGIPRDGGLADLLAEAASPAPRFAAVMCEDIERSGRDTYNALKLEKELSQQGILLFATDEPISVGGANATTVLVRRVKQGVAEWYRLQIKEKAWKGLREHSLAGWNIGHVPYGYTAIRVPHPVPAKAAQGLTKTRLGLDEVCGPVVRRIFDWRTADQIGAREIARRLNMDPGRYPAPDPDKGWNAFGVYSLLANPKYTGHMVFGRTSRATGRARRIDPADWLWSPAETHPAIVTRTQWETAQGIGAEHGTSRDGNTPAPHPAARRTYVLRGRVRCRDCGRRMSGTTTASGNSSLTTYRCPHDANTPRHVAAFPDHPRTVTVREDYLLAAIRQFFGERITGPDRRALLAAAIPAGAAERAARAERQAAEIDTRLRQIDAAETGLTRELETLSADTSAPGAALTALRSRIVARFGELETERADLTARRAALDTATAQPQDPALLDALPDLAGILERAPRRLQARLYDAFGIQALYNREDNQVTIRATLTTSTPDAITAVMADDAELTASLGMCHLLSDPLGTATP